MNFLKTDLEGVFVLKFKQLGDDRGWFTRSYCQKEFEEIGFTENWVQHNHSFTKYKGTVRGMHYQIGAYQEVKLVRCIAGKVLDVVVDLRENSLTFLKYFSIELSEEDLSAVFIPKGFAHGFQTLTDDCQLLYCHSEFYNPDAEAGVLYNDPAIGINWPLQITELSKRDSNHPVISPNLKK